MTLELQAVSRREGTSTYIYETSQVFQPGSFNVLLGATRSGKTTLMQVMAGIQKPTSGRIFHNGREVTFDAVQKRNVSMVYQQFINYPMLNVFDNIASPLRVAGIGEDEIKKRVGKVAELLRLGPMLARKPNELSGGQQQRTAIARAIIKDSDLIFLDEPLANLDYKLREELREELPKLFAGRNAIVFYATTEPHEALLFGGNTATLHEGRIIQFGPTAEIYREPNSMLSAQVFSDPPINLANVEKCGAKLVFGNGVEWATPEKLISLRDGIYEMALRPHHVVPAQPSWKDSKLNGRVLVTEISGSESVVHFDVNGKTWVSQAHGVHSFRVGEIASFQANVEQGMIFTTQGLRVA